VIRLDRQASRGATLAVRRDELPPPGEDEYYAADLVGVPVEDEAGRPLGRVREVTPGVANDVLELDTGLLLPMVAECVREVDLDRGRIVIAPGFSDPQLP
jgi:16S rRNA processing protein RimM